LRHSSAVISNELKSLFSAVCRFTGRETSCLNMPMARRATAGPSEKPDVGRPGSQAKAVYHHFFPAPPVATRKGVRRCPGTGGQSGGAGNARKLTQANGWKVTHPSGVLFFPMSVYDSSSPGLWEVCETARVGGGGRARRGAGSRFASACGNGGPGAAAGGGSGAQRRGRPPLGPRFPSGAAPSIAHACVGWAGAAGRGRRRVARPRRDGGAVARKISRQDALQATISPRPLPGVPPPAGLSISSSSQASVAVAMALASSGCARGESGGRAARSSASRRRRPAPIRRTPGSWSRSSSASRSARTAG
jgi:hypothetical protein